MDQSEKPKGMNLPESLKAKLLKMNELKEQADLRRKKVESISDKEITENEQSKTE